MYNYSDLSELDLGDIQVNVSLINHTSWCIGGPADIFIEPHSVLHIRRIIRYSTSNKIPLVVIGNGSNILVNDEGVRGIVMKLGNKFSNVSIENTTIIADAGISTAELAKKAAVAGLSGLEHVVGIPGTLGGLVFMNGGSKGQCIGDIVKKVWVIDDKANCKAIPKKDCHFSYRNSALQNSKDIIYKIELECIHKDKNIIFNEMQDILDQRRKKIPSDFPNCGSVFLSIPSISSTLGPPGRLIEEAGLKGYRVGDTQVSLHHGNFIVNLGKARAQDVITIVQDIRKIIFQKVTYCLESEVKYITPYGEIMPLHLVKNNV